MIYIDQYIYICLSTLYQNCYSRYYTYEIKCQTKSTHINACELSTVDIQPFPVRIFLHISNVDVKMSVVFIMLV